MTSFHALIVLIARPTSLQEIQNTGHIAQQNAGKMNYKKEKVKREIFSRRDGETVGLIHLLYMLPKYDADLI